MKPQMLTVRETQPTPEYISEDRSLVARLGHFATWIADNLSYARLYDEFITAQFKGRAFNLETRTFD